MITLSIDTTGNNFSLSLFKHDLEIYYYIDNEIQMQSKKLVPEISKAFLLSKLALTDIDYLVINIGPGSFTGIRIGMAAAEGIALVVQKPIIGINSFEALSLTKGLDTCLITVNAGRGNYYCQEYNGKELIAKPFLLSKDEIENLYAQQKIVGALQTEEFSSNSSMLARAAIYKNFIQNEPISPLYIGGKWN